MVKQHDGKSISELSYTADIHRAPGNVDIAVEAPVHTPTILDKPVINPIHCAISDEQDGVVV